MGYEDNQLLATAALLAPVVEQWPELASLLPPAVKEQLAATAVRQALALAAGTAEPPRFLKQQPAQRLAIFARLGDHEPGPDQGYLPPRPLQIGQKEGLFPQAAVPATALRAAYQELPERLAAGLTAAADLSLSAYRTAVMTLWQRELWWTPNPYQPGEADSSLFDLSRITAALAPVCAAGQGISLFSGDISGVQDFIYTITARGAASGLRGRSLYLQLLTEAVAAFVCRELAVPETAIFYAGGGHFYLIAPTPAAAQLDDLRQTISRKLLRHHQGALYLALGTAGMSPADLQPANFSAAWKRLAEATNQAKARRFSELGAAMAELIFTPQPAGADAEHECQVCHYGATDQRAFFVDAESATDSGQPLRVCHLCKSFEALGRDLRQANYLLTTAVAPQEGARHDYQAALAEFGYRARPVAAPPNRLDEAGRTVLLALNDEAARSLTTRVGETMVPVQLRYMVNVTPIVRQADIERFQDKRPQAAAEQPRLREIKSFGLLGTLSQGIDRLGVLRMDVDDLGDLFTAGNQRQRGLTQTAALSFALSLFFEGWLETICRAVSGERDVVYTIYSGGDDLFIVGAWDVLPELAYQINQDLQAYAAGNPLLHASAGITLHGGKYPLYQAAQDAAAALDKAKGMAGKNAFTFLDRTFTWSQFGDIQAMFDQLNQLLAQGAPQSLLQHLLRLDALYQQHKWEQIQAGKRSQVYWGPWHWLNAYQLTRLAERKKPLAAKIREIRDSLSRENFSRIEWMAVSARWAQLYQRGEKRRA